MGVKAYEKSGSIKASGGWSDCISQLGLIRTVPTGSVTDNSEVITSIAVSGIAVVGCRLDDTTSQGRRAE